MKAKPLVIVTRRLPQGIETRMRDLFDAHLNLDDIPMDANALKTAVKSAEVLVPTVTDRVGAEIIEAAGPQLRLIANFGVGFNHIDVKTARAKGIAVSNTPGVLTDATADITMTLMLAVTRRALEGSDVLKSGKFGGWNPTWMMGVGLRGRSLGIVGMGRIGEAVAQRDSTEVVDTLVRADVTVAPVHTPLSVLDDPHVAAEGRLLPAQIGEVAGRLPPLPYESNVYGFSVRHQAPGKPGEHTREVLLELGYRPEEIEAFARETVIRGPDLPTA